MEKPRLLIFIPAYKASGTIAWVLERIPDDLVDTFDLHVLVVDDASGDDTAETAVAYLHGADRPFTSTVLVNPENRGYGGNQKLGYTYAAEEGFDVVAMVHGDGQYPPEEIGPLVRPIIEDGVGACFGSRFLRKGGAIAGGMPRYKFMANRFLTRIQNRVLDSDLSEFHSGFRAYSVNDLMKLPIHLNSDDFHFDTEIIIQAIRAGMEIAEIDIPTYYGDEVCYVNGTAYGLNVLGQSARAVVHDKGLFYEAKYDVETVDQEVRYPVKTDFVSPTTLTAAAIEPGSRVLDLGSGAGGVALMLAEKNCRVFGVDMFEPPNPDLFDQFWLRDLDTSSPLPGDVPPVETIVMLDVIEHLRRPEEFVEAIRDYCENAGTVERLIVSTGNIGFFVVRAALLLGQFNYGSRGILDRTHTRLFTFSSFRRLFRQAGFGEIEVRGIPAPFPMAIENRSIANAGLALNSILIKIKKRLFSYQILLILSPPIAQSRRLADSRVVSALPSHALDSVD